MPPGDVSPKRSSTAHRRPTAANRPVARVVRGMCNNSTGHGHARGSAVYSVVTEVRPAGREDHRWQYRHQREESLLVAG